MCLRTRQICPSRARRDIVCYKVFHVNNSHSMRTLYRDCYIRRPTRVYPTLMDDTNTPLTILQCGYPCIAKGSRYQIFGGMIHAFKLIPNPYFIKAYDKERVYKCIIPKGTLYYVGVDGDICAKQMLVIEEVNPNTAG